MVCMVQERCVLPVKCADCGTVFDLWYDLQAQEQLRNEVGGDSASVLGQLLGAQNLCWNCRKKAVEDDPEANELAYDIDIEFE